MLRQARIGIAIWAVGLLLPTTLLAADETAKEATDVASICGRCHEGPVALALETGGHAEGVVCTDCHRDRRRGRFGRRHRTIVSCANHHESQGHPAQRAKRSTGRKRKLIRNCITCHEQHGSTNSSLVRESIRVRRRRIRTVRFDNEKGAEPGGFTDPTAAGSGVCEICHRKTAFYRRDGGGESHFDLTCTLCHKHGARFEPIIGKDDCADCHADTAALFAKTSLHSTNLSCNGCHDQLSSSPGPAHRRVPDCTQCHPDLTHGPPNIEALACTRCHEPHGTDNIKLIRNEVTTLQGEIHSIDFGEDRVFVSASEPGSGICEICHTTTRFFRDDGSGDLHAPVSCPTCHDHSEGFVEGTHTAAGDGEFSCLLCHSEQNCTVCHADKANLFQKTSLHRSHFPSCSSCHDELSSSLGPGHRRCRIAPMLSVIPPPRT